jgi:hypothetical protein
LRCEAFGVDLDERRTAEVATMDGDASSVRAETLWPSRAWPAGEDR